MYTLRHKKEFQFKFQQWICVWLRETLEEKKTKHRGINWSSRQLPTRTLLLSSPPWRSVYISKQRRSGYTFCWLTLHISIILKATAAQAAAPANDYLPEFATPVKL